MAVLKQWNAITETWDIVAGVGADLQNYVLLTDLTVTLNSYALKSGKLSQFAATTSAELASIISDETGTGSLVFSDNARLIAPLLGTPTQGVLTNCTGLPVGTGLDNVSSQMAYFITNPNSLNLRTALGSGYHTGTGAAVFAISPALTTPILGTPTSGTLTNCTGLPIGGITGLYTGVAAFLATPTSSTLLTALITKTGTGLAVFGTAPEFQSGIKVLNPSGVNGINIGVDSSNAANSGRIILENGTTGKGICLYNYNNGLYINTLATYGSSSGTNRVFISETGNVGINITGPQGKLHVYNPQTDSAASVYGSYFDAKNTITANSSYSSVGIVTYSGNGDIPVGITCSGSSYGILSDASTRSTTFAGTLTNSIGVYGASGIVSGVSGALVTNSYCFKGITYGKISGATITNAYGLHLAVDVSGGPSTLTNYWGIYQTYASGGNYLAAPLYIGATTEVKTDAKLHVNGILSALASTHYLKNTGANVQLWLSSKQSTAGSYVAQLIFANDNTTAFDSVATISAVRGTVDEEAYLDFYVQDSSSSNNSRLRILPDGRVQIGTQATNSNSSSLAYSTTIASSSLLSSDFLSVRNNYSTDSTGYAAILLQSRTSTIASGRICILGNNTTSVMAFQVRPSTGADTTVEVMRLNADKSALFAGAVTSTQFILSALNTAPASAVAAGTLNEIRITAGYIYIYVAANTWVRAALTTW